MRPGFSGRAVSGHVSPRTTTRTWRPRSPPCSRLKVGDPVFFMGASGHAYHVASVTEVDPNGLDGWTIEARGRAWGVVRYRISDPTNGVRRRGGKFYRYPGIDLGELTGDEDMPIEQFSQTVKAEMEKAQKTLVAAGILANDTRPVDNVPTMGYVDLIAARIVEAIKSGKLVAGRGP